MDNQSEEIRPSDATSYASLTDKKKKEPKKISLALSLFLIFIAAVFAFQISSYYISARFRSRNAELINEMNRYSALTEMASAFDSHYIYDVDEDEMSDTLLHAYAYYSGDQYAAYYNAEEWEAYAEESGGTSTGIGSYIAETEEGIYLTFVMDGSPAMNAGLADGDIITEVAGQSVTELGFDAAVDLIRGEVGSTIDLTILRGGETMTFSVLRTSYENQSVIARTMEDNGKKIGYVHIIQFHSNTSTQFKNAVNALLKDGCEGLIFDVRSNPGGELNAVCTMLDFLLPKGPIVNLYFKDENGDLTLTQTVSSDANEIDVPMVIIVNDSTASAAELFTSALKDYNKVTIVGIQTYGKGCGQSAYPISDEGVLMVTSFLYSPPYSGNYDRIGITPDIVVDLTEECKSKNMFLLTYEEDLQLQAATKELFSKLK